MGLWWPDVPPLDGEQQLDGELDGEQQLLNLGWSLMFPSLQLCPAVSCISWIKRFCFTNQPTRCKSQLEAHQLLQGGSPKENSGDSVYPCHAFLGFTVVFYHQTQEMHETASIAIIATLAPRKQSKGKW